MCEIITLIKLGFGRPNRGTLLVDDFPLYHDEGHNPYLILTRGGGPTRIYLSSIPQDPPKSSQIRDPASGYKTLLKRPIKGPHPDTRVELTWGVPAQFVAYKRTTHLYPSRIDKWGPDPTLAGGSCWSLWRVMLVILGIQKEEARVETSSCACAGRWWNPWGRRLIFGP